MCSDFITHVQVKSQLGKTVSDLYNESKRHSEVSLMQETGNKVRASF
jgi:hypothetical protein